MNNAQHRSGSDHSAASAYMPFRPYRPRIHCSLDTLFHAGALRITRAVAIGRENRHG